MKIVKLKKEDVANISFSRGAYAELYEFLKGLGKDEGAKIMVEEESELNENAPRNHCQAVHSYARKMGKVFRTKHFEDHFFIVRVK